jgi:hypothetical protein
MADAERVSWTSDIRPFAGYDPHDPRPPQDRARDLCLAVLKERGLERRVGLELSQGVQAMDRMVGEPTVFPNSGSTRSVPDRVRSSTRQVYWHGRG